MSEMGHVQAMPISDISDPGATKSLVERVFHEAFKQLNIS